MEAAYKFLNKNGLPVFVGLALFFTLIGFGQYDSTTQSTEIETIGAALNVAIGFGCAAVAIILLAHTYLGVLDPKRLMKFGLGIMVLAIIYGISYGVSDTAIPAGTAKNIEITPGEMRVASSLILTTAICIIIAVLGVVANEIVKLVK